MRSELIQEDREALEKALEAALTDEKIEPLKKKARELSDSIVDDIEWSLKDYLAHNLSCHVSEMAGRAVEALLAGNQDEMVRWLQCDNRSYNGRSDGCSPRPIEQQHPIIHGKLFDTGSVQLRRKIVEAHRDLITEQRILDLEDQVRSLVAQNNKMESERDAWRNKALDYMPR